MWEKLRVVFTIPELRKKILLTIALLAVYRVGYWVTLPVVNQASLSGTFGGEGGLADLIAKASVFSASNLSQATIFGLGIMPYISASIIFQLLGSVWKPLEQLRKEGESGRKKINEYTRYLTVVLCLVQSYFYVRFFLMNTEGDGLPALIDPAFLSDVTNNLHFGWQIASVLIMTCGTVFLMWLGEQIDEFGIGNGISLLIMAGILAQMPGALFQLLNPQNMQYRLVHFGSGEIGIETLILLIILFVAVVAAWSLLRWDNGGSPRRAPNTSAVVACTEELDSTSLSGSTRRASCRSFSPAAC
jgi:preprotein translocase subunit SecY